MYAAEPAIDTALDDPVSLAGQHGAANLGGRHGTLQCFSRGR
jgi:hypothetical protein